MYNVDYAGLSKRIKTIRFEKDITQEDVASKLNISTNTYMSYENNPKDMKLSILLDLSKILGVNMQDIFLEYVDTNCSKAK